MPNTKIFSLNPATLDTIGNVDITPINSLPEIIKSARDSFHNWADRSFSQRKYYFDRLKREILENRDDIVNLISEENGKPLVEALTADILPVLESIKYYTKNAEMDLTDEDIRFGNPILRRKKSRVIFEPFGVIGIIAPYNYPFSIPMNQIVAALIAGNSVVMKGSELTPLVGQKIYELFENAGFPDGIVQVIQGYGDLGSAFIKSGVDKIVFTGSTAKRRRQSGDH